MDVRGATALYLNSNYGLGTDQSIAIQSILSYDKIRVIRSSGVSVFGIRWLAIGWPTI